MSKQTDALRAYFDARGIKQRELADKLGLHEGTVSSILSGRYGIALDDFARWRYCGAVPAFCGL